MMILIRAMENTDYLDLDGRQLRLLLTIHKTGSLSAAARVLDMNQSTVSYWLDLMRKRLGDPLFIRAGNGVEPTAHAKALFPAAREALRHLEMMCQREDYDPQNDTGVLRFSATTVERDLIIAPLLRFALDVAPGMMIEVGPSDSPRLLSDRLRRGEVDFVIMPDRLHEGEGIMRRRFADFENAVFFDPAYPLAEGDIDAFCARPQARVALGPDAGFSVDRRLARLGKTRHVALQASDFDSVLNLIKGTNVIATLPQRLAVNSAAHLSHIAPPWPQSSLELVVYWHTRNQAAARHKFWRDALFRAQQSVETK